MGQTDGRIAVSLNASRYDGGRHNNVKLIESDRLPKPGMAFLPRDAWLTSRTIADTG